MSLVPINRGKGFKRITDKYRHFLGKIEKGNIYIYCQRCKEFILVAMDDKNKDPNKSIA